MAALLVSAAAASVRNQDRVVAGSACNDHAPAPGKFKRRARPDLFLRGAVAGAHVARMIRCGVFLHRLTKKMHRTRRFMMLFVDRLLRKAE
ncbi:MAG TPA: hypothetical protein VEQ16_02760 [Acidocella sp.]|jgi:hypothetical protein|nr:hypothetical protein [Acidocella sp.]